MTDDLHHLAGAYALDALDDDERSAFERHLAGCPACEIEVREFHETAALLSDDVAETPPTGLRDSVLAQIGETRQDSPIVTPLPRARTRRTSVLVAAAVVVAALAGAVALAVRGGGETELVDADDAIVTALEGPGGNLQVVWSADRDQVAVIGTGLADLDDEEIYQLWFLHGDGVVSAALFAAEDGMVNAIFDVADVDPDGFGVTIEPIDGSDQPTSEVLYAGLI